MNLSTHHPKWNYQEFLTFILIYASYADMEFSEAERQLIRDHIDPERASELEEEFKTLSDYERIQTIQSYKGLYYPTSERKDELLYRIKSLFESDGQFSIMEKNMLRMLKKIM